MPKNKGAKGTRLYTALFLLLAFLFSGCSDPISQSLLLSCEKLKTNLLTLNANQKVFEKMYSEKINSFQNLGAKWDGNSRRALVDYVNEKFESLGQNLDERIYSKFMERELNGMYKNSTENLIKYLVLVDATKGTGFKLEISDTFLENIKNETEATREANTNLLNKDIERIMGSLTVSESGVTGNMGCSLITQEVFKEELKNKVDPNGTLDDFLSRANPRNIFMNAEDGYKSMFFSMSSLVLCEIKGETEEYESTGDGTPGKYVMTKCLK
jgi:hypothetical protein